MKNNEAVLFCFGEEVVHGLAKYFEAKLDGFLEQQSSAALASGLSAVNSTTKSSAE
jgi:hypothetical protein